MHKIAITVVSCWHELLPLFADVLFPLRSGGQGTVCAGFFEKAPVAIKIISKRLKPAVEAEVSAVSNTALFPYHHSPMHDPACVQGIRLASARHAHIVRFVAYSAEQAGKHAIYTELGISDAQFLLARLPGLA